MTERVGVGHEELRDDLAAYALGALTPDEAAELEGHLAGCEPCRARLRWLEPAVDMLPASVKQLPPPPALRARLLETVRAEAAEAAEPSRPADEPARRRLGWGAWALRPATAFAAIAAIVVGVAGGYALRGSEDDAATTVAATNLSPGGMSGELVREGDNGTLHLSDMPPIARDEVYEVWVQRDETMVPASTFVLDRDRSAVAAVPELEDGDAVLVTREPYGGSMRPTTEPLLEVPLS